MIKMWLDDVRPIPSRYTHWVKSSDAAIDLLKTGMVEECSLDHDLGSEYGTGYDVAKWIEEKAHSGELSYVKCNAHSQNPVGAQNMKLAIKSAYRAWGV